MPRSDSDSRADAAAALAVVTPGQTWTGMPAARSASISSVERPNIDGSPPFSRTTRRPARADSTSQVSIVP